MEVAMQSLKLLDGWLFKKSQPYKNIKKNLKPPTEHKVNTTKIQIYQQVNENKITASRKRFHFLAAGDNTQL